jgi:prevent-host-death family protein
MRIASVAEVKAKLSKYLRETKESGPVVITRNGKAVAEYLTTSFGIT